MTIAQARDSMANALKDKELRRTYIDNISCVLMDRILDLIENKKLRDEISEEILTKIFEQ